MQRPQDVFRCGARSRRLIPFLPLAQREHASSRRHQEEILLFLFQANRSEELFKGGSEEGPFFPGAQAISNCSSPSSTLSLHGRNHLLCARKAPALYTAVVIIIITTTKSLFSFQLPRTFFSLTFLLQTLGSPCSS